MADNYEAVLEEITKQFLTLDFEKAAQASGCQYDKAAGVLRLEYFGEIHTVDCKTGRILPDSSEVEKVDRMHEKISIINYFNRYPMYQGTPMSGKWLPLRELPEGGALFVPAFKHMAMAPLAAAFGMDSKLLYDTMGPMKAVKAAMGHAAVTVHAFPHIPITLLVWEGDEEIPAAGNVLFDSSISQYAHIEDIIGLGIIAVRRAVRCCKPLS